MSSWPENNISCPICHDIYQNPVILLCSHSFCRTCWQQWRTQRQTPECPVCRRTCPSYDPPQNLALRQVCEAFSNERGEGHSAAPSELCSLHAEKFKLFCLQDQQLVCPICRYSRCHTNHSFRPLEEAAAEHRATLQELLRPVHEKKDLLTVAGDNFNQALQNIELQCRDMERQIKDMFSTLQSFLKKEEEVRLAALNKEKQQKNQSLRMKHEAMKREATSLADIISSTEKELRAEDVPFLQSYPNLATSVQLVLSSSTDPTPEPLMEVDKHLNNLPFSVWDKIKGTISSTYQCQSPIRTVNAQRVCQNDFEFEHEYVMDLDAGYSTSYIPLKPAPVKTAPVKTAPVKTAPLKYQCQSPIRTLNAQRVCQNDFEFEHEYFMDLPDAGYSTSSAPLDTQRVGDVTVGYSAPIQRYNSFLTFTSRARRSQIYMDLETE